jgi:hypothetical protein
MSALAENTGVNHGVERLLELGNVFYDLVQLQFKINQFIILY